MSGLQSIINLAETITIDRRRVLGVQYTRSEVAKTNETVTRNTWKFNITVPAMLAYDENRSLFEDIDRLDRQYPQVISFSSSTGLSYMFAYQGDMEPSDINGVTVQSWTGTVLTLANLPNIGSSQYMFKKGDFIQIANYPYPVTSQYDVVRGGGTTVAVTTHRPNFIGTATNNKHILVGNAVQFNMFCNNMPTYKMNPGGSTTLVTFSGPFQFYEYTGDV
jgi:hypothetical protein